jgi:hypothetical protein
MIGATSPYFAKEWAEGVRFITLSVTWSEAEPSQGVFNSNYVASVQRAIVTARTVGFGVILDPGLQYTPSWVFKLPGGTRFVDQYGDVYSGPAASGNNVANAVTDMSARAAEAVYLHWLGNELPKNELEGVRVGGGPLGELRYPSGSYNGHTDCFWAYDASSRAASPVPGWVPRTGTTTEAASFLAAYNEHLNSFGEWLDGQAEKDFRTTELVMLPGWGERPGVAAKEIATRLGLGYEEFSEGLDWTALLPALPDRAHSVAYTTYLDAPSYSSSPQLTDPADYIASIASPFHMRSAGENTRNGTVADLRLIVARAVRLHFVVVNWMDQSQVISTDRGTDPGGPTMSDFHAADQALLGSA